ncbi:MAG: ferrous iron transport protein B [Clostridia bacterium]|nr:ferrous iron transport protein B [Clostridia bacterium]
MKTIALAGNPNVGKTTLFNSLTGMKQHTGNWTGKTVELAEGMYDRRYRVVDLPGTYSLSSRSPEEEIAREFIASGEADIILAVCDASTLERNLTLVLQILEITPKVILVLNLWDEAEKYGVRVDIEGLSELLHIPVVRSTANLKRGNCEVISALDKELGKGYRVTYDKEIEYALTLIDDRYSRGQKLAIISGERIEEPEFIHAYEYLWGIGYYPEKCCDLIAERIAENAHSIADATLSHNEKRIERTRRIDSFITGRFTAIPIMLLLLCGVLYITVKGANYPSALLSNAFNIAEGYINRFLIAISVPVFLREMLVYGLWRVLGWVVAVMLPPMAIFFPLFTLLEDSGFLPRIAYNMDTYFCRAGSCGKQSLTMCMGLGCNAVGVCGCRIIDSPRERLVGILTNVFVPCNGRFPMLIILISLFFAEWLSPLVLCGVILFGIFVTLTMSYILSNTILRGKCSAFTLELPPYRMPRIGEVLVRSFLDRTLFVLGRAVAVAAPAGVLIWLMANINLSGQSVLAHISAFLDPFAAMFGLDGVILVAFILGFPANEIVLPLMIMGYTGSGVLADIGNIGQLRDLLVTHGWDITKCISVLIFCICHFPCSTTLLTIKKETGSLRWTLAAFLIPLITGLGICYLLNI